MNLARALAGAVAVAAAVALLAGCGGTSDSQQVNSAIRTYLAGIANRNGQQSCNQLTPAAAQGLLTSANQQDPNLGAKSCAEVLNALSRLITASEKQQLLDAKIRDIKIKGNSATATVQGGDRAAELVKTNGHWLIRGGVGS